MSETRTTERTSELSLDQAQHRWNEFVDAIGHELRTPLTAIIGFQELLEDGIYGKLPDPCQTAVGRIGSASQELLALLNGMVDLARPAQAPPELEIDDVSLDLLFAEAAQVGRRLAPDRDVRWSDEPASGLGSIHSDARRLQRALFLAILAAVRATPGGQLHLSARRLDDIDGAELHLRGAAFDHLPTPPLADIVLHRAREGEDRSLLRLSLAVDTLTLLGCGVRLEQGALVVRLVSAEMLGRRSTVDGRR